jgi:DNA invertase Pin-like site-specific DNA recombinase
MEAIGYVRVSTDIHDKGLSRKKHFSLHLTEGS